MSDYLPRLPYIVIDQNRLRDRDIMAALFRRCRQEGVRILLPDTAIYEFSNVHDPHLTWRRSLEEVCREPELFVAGRSIGEMMKSEIKTGTTVTNIVDEEVTQRFQRLLSELRGGNDKRMNQALSEIAKFIEAEKQLREQHSVNKSIVTYLRNAWQNSLPDEDLKLLRRPDSDTFIRILAEFNTASIVYQAAKNDGCSEETAFALTLGPSVYGHTVYALAALALDWLSLGGLDGTDPVKVTNDFFDLDYIVTATYCKELITEDQRAKRIFAALEKAFERRAVQIKDLESQSE